MWLGGASWVDLPRVDGIDSRNLAVSLLHKSLQCLYASRGLISTQDSRSWYVPDGLVPGNWLYYSREGNGKLAKVNAINHRTFKGRDAYSAHLSPHIVVVRGSTQPFMLSVQLRVQLFDSKNLPLDPGKIPSRRKLVCRSWWNDEWRVRIAAVLRLLAGGSDFLVIGPAGPSQVRISASPITYELPVSVNDSETDEVDREYTEAMAVAEVETEDSDA